MAHSGVLKVNVVSATQQIWECDAKMVVARTTEGAIGILPGHEPMLALLASGEVQVTEQDGSVRTANADEGYFSVNADRVTIVARNASIVDHDAKAGY